MLLFGIMDMHLYKIPAAGYPFSLKKDILLKRLNSKLTQLTFHFHEAEVTNSSL